MPINDTTGVFYSALKVKMIEILNLVANSARNKVAWSTKIRSNIRVSEVKEKAGIIAGYVEVGGTALNEHGQSVNVGAMARAFEYGSGEHATKGEIGKYPILPRNATALSFIGTNEWKGQPIIVPPMGGGVVMHPGVAPRPFLHPAVEENQNRIRELLGKEVRQYIGSIIKTAWDTHK